MTIKYILQLIKNAPKVADGIKLGLIEFSNYLFLFRDISYISKIFNLKYTSDLCYIGLRRKLSGGSKEGKTKKYKYNLNYNKYKVQDLYYASAIKTLIPSLVFGGDELFFEVGMVVKTPLEQIFPATFYWGKSGLTIGGWKQNSFDDFIMLIKKDRKISFAPLRFSTNEKDDLAEAFQYALRNVYISDFEGEYWEEIGGTQMGIKAGKPFITDIPIDENPRHALIYYKGKFWEILHKCMTPNDRRIFKERLDKQEEPNPEISRMIVNKLNQYLIEKCYNLLITYVHQARSRYAFQALGYFLMEHGARITNELKIEILENSRWRDERYGLNNINTQIERRRSLFNFRAMILSY